MSTIKGDAGNNALTGGLSDDIIDGGAGADLMTGGLNDDTYYVDNAGDQVIENAGEGIDTVISTIALATAFANVENYVFNTTAAVTFTGSTANNVINGGAGNDTINGGGGSGDELSGGAGNDKLTTGGGDDDLDGGTGADTLSGGSGDDLYYVDNVGDQVIEALNGGTQDEVISTISISKLWDNVESLELSGSGNLNATGNASTNKITGTAGNNVLDGGSGADVLIGGKGNDTYIVDNSNDVVIENTNEGTDLVESSVDYTLSSNVENLTLTGNADIDGNGNTGNNIITGNAGKNTLDGGLGNDTLIGGNGDDTYIVDNSTDKIVETATGGHDTVESAVNYTLAANVEDAYLEGNTDTTLTGNALVNDLIGNNGDNVLDGAAGADTMQGEGGDDTYHVDNTGDHVFENANNGTDTVISSVVLTAEYANVENYTFKTSAKVTFTGDSGDNILIGGSGNDVLNGGAGSGDDTLDGGAGADTLTGGAGDDTYDVDNIGDQVIELANGGTDTVNSSVSVTKLWDNVERAFLLGTGNLNLTGNSLNNILSGNAGNNVIDGGAGADFMAGGAGNDTYFVDNTSDAILETANQGTDLVKSLTDFTLGNYIENLTMIGTGSSTGIGNDLNNIITGNVGDNNLDGGLGDDTLIGGAGNDTYYVDNSGDKVVEGVNAGHDLVISTASYTLSANVEDLNLQSTADINGTGNASNNELIGNAGDNILDGKAGADEMSGGDGDDTYYMDNIGDIINEAANQGNDTVISTVGFDHEILNVENYTFNVVAGVTFAGDTGDNIIKGGTGSDKFYGGGAGKDQLYGGAGGDSLTGGTDQDILDGGTGSDIMAGGDGNDLYYVDNLGDQVIETANGGTADDVFATVSYTLPVNVEWGGLLGAANLNLTGNAAGNILVGNDGNNIIDGGAGADGMKGGKGNDTFIVDNTSDLVQELAGEGTDLVKSSVNYALSDNVENLTLTGTAAINGTGNALDNVITGNAAANILDGGAGDDTMSGGLGSDEYIVDSANDKVIEATNGGDFDVIVSSVSYNLAAAPNVEDITLTGTAYINATGNALNNIVDGNSGDNVLDGAAGADIMAGGDGDDTYYMDNAKDHIDELAGGGIDTVISSVAFSTEIANVESYTFNTAVAVNFTGDAGFNEIRGGSGNDVISGGIGGADRLYGDAGNDTLTTGAGDDTLDGGVGADKMTGGAGNDTYGVDNIGDQVIEAVNGGTDTINASITITKLADNVEWGVLTGTANINMTGNDLANMLWGNNGNNALDGGAGDDTMTGGLGNDTYYVNSTGDQVIEAANGGTDLVESSVSWTLGNNVENLTLTGTGNIDGSGNSENNILTGNAGANQLDGQAGADTMIGGAGDDTYFVDDAADKIVEAVNGGFDLVFSSVTYSIANEANVEEVILTGSGNTNVTGNAGDNSLSGTSGNNTLSGGAGADSLEGYDGFDVLDGGAGNDVMDGGKGDDTFYVDSTKDIVTEQANEGTDTVISSVALTQLYNNVENYTFNTTSAINLAFGSADNVIRGGSGNDVINGGGGLNGLFGNAGNDTLTAGSGDDTIDGGAGIDKMTGGAGDDFYYVDNAGDQVIENASEGNDTVQSTISIAALFANVEQLDLVGGNLNGTGNALNNVIYGTGGNNVLDGGTGADLLEGGGGNDTYIVDASGDIVVETQNQGTDLVRSSVNYALSANVENLTLTGTANLSGTGNSLDNVITGNAGDNSLDGQGGDDMMIGGAGNDKYYVASADDKVVEAANGGTDTVYASVSYTLSANIETLVLTSTSGTTGTGNAGDNEIDGNAGNDILDGGAGADKLIGGAGDDVYYIDNIKDQVIEDSNDGTDTVHSKVALTGIIANVENYFFDTSTAINFTGNAGSNIIYGGSGNDLIQGGGGTDDLHGEAGNDTLIAGAGDDVLDGGTGADKMTGGGGNDTYFVDNVSDQVTELAGGGVDMVFSTATITKLWDNVENVALYDNGNINVTGNDLGNIIHDNAGNNVINGGAGDDTIDSFGGNDTLTGGTGSDLFAFDMAPWPVTYHATITDFNKSQDSLSFADIGDVNNDNAVDLTDLNQSIASIVDGGMGKNVDVTLIDGQKITFAGIGTGTVNSISDLVANPTTQISVS